MRGSRITVALFAMAACVYAVFIARCTFVLDGTRSLTLFDDAMISMRYARNLVEAGALTWNVGEPTIEGYTNLLWTAWMAVVHALPLADLQTSFAIAITGAVVVLLTARAVLAIARCLDARTSVVVISVIATLFCYSLVFWTLRGMEVGLLTCIATTGLFIVVRAIDGVRPRDRVVLVMCTVSALLTRTDAIVFVIVWIGAAATCLPRGERRGVVIALVVATIATLAAHSLFRKAYYGAWMPNTYYLKLEGIALGARLQRGTYSVIRLLQAGWLVPCVLAAFAFAAPEHRRHKLVLALQMASCGAYSVYVGGDAWEELLIPNRYITAGLPALFILAALGSAVVATSLQWSRLFALALCAQAALSMGELVDPSVVQALPRPTDVRVTAALLAVGCACVLLVRPRATWTAGAAMVLLTAHAPWLSWSRHNAAHVAIDIERVRHGLAIREATSPDATIATVPCGSIPYFARRRTIDLLGKSDARIAHAPPRTTTRFHPGHVKWNNAYTIGELQPDLVDEIFVPQEPALVDADLAAMPGWGYQQITPAIYVRRDTRLVDVSRLLNGLRPR